MYIWIYIGSGVFFALVAIYFSYRYEKVSEKVAIQKKEIARRVFELQLLKTITEEIGYSLNIETVSETIALTIENVMDLSTVSYAIVEPSKIIVKTFPKEPVSSQYFTEVAKLIMGAMTSINPALSTLPCDQVVADTTKNFSENVVNATPKSYFNIPFFLDNLLVGMISISSTKEVKYDDTDMELLFKIVETGQNAVQKLRDVIKNEESKTQKVRADFTDVMMHELRAPLTAIRGAAALMTSGKLPTEEAEKMPKVILESSNDMLATVADFLDAAKMDEGKFKLNLMKGSLSKIIADHLEVFGYAAREKEVTVNFDKNADATEFYFDQIRVGQVINNLISNSIKFSKPGGKIDVSIHPHDHEIEVMVADNGIGIPDAKKAILFTKFGQIDGNLEKLHSANPNSGSSGLGLFISRQIVSAHNGKIWLESTEDVGTVAHFTLPLILDEKTALAGDVALSMAN